MVAHTISHGYALADAAPYSHHAAGAHTHTYPTAISLYFTYFDTYASGISVTVCSGKRITESFNT